MYRLWKILLSNTSRPETFGMALVKSNLVHFSFKILHLVGIILIIFWYTNLLITNSAEHVKCIEAQGGNGKPLLGSATGYMHVIQALSASHSQQRTWFQPAQAAIACRRRTRPGVYSSYRIDRETLWDDI